MIILNISIVLYKVCT